MTKYISSFAITLTAFVFIDLVWLMWLARATYVAEIGQFLRKAPNLPAAAVFYVLYAAGLVVFAVSPAVKENSPLLALWLGGALGLVAYGTYDLTNLAVGTGFTTRIALIDMIWGTALSGVVAVLTAKVVVQFT